jgi:hypothetical protein
MLHAVVTRLSRNSFSETSLKKKPRDKLHSTTVNFPADRPKSGHASQPRTACLNDAMQHEQKILVTKRIAIAGLHDSARREEKLPLVKCIVIARGKRHFCPCQGRMARCSMIRNFNGRMQRKCKVG